MIFRIHLYFVFETDSHQIIRSQKFENESKKKTNEQIIMFRMDGAVDSGECHYIHFNNLAALEMVSSFFDCSMVVYDYYAIQYVLSIYIHISVIRIFLYI